MPIKIAHLIDIKVSKYIIFFALSLGILLGAAHTSQAFFSSGGGSDTGGETNPTPSPTVSPSPEPTPLPTPAPDDIGIVIDYNPITGELDVTLDQDVNATIAVYYSTENQTNAAETAVTVGDNGETTLYLGSCSGVDCTPDDVKRIVIKVQVDGTDTVVVQRVEVDEDGNESIFSEYTDDTTNLSDDELAWLLEVISTPSPTPSPTPTPTPTTNPDNNTSNSDNSGSSSTGSSGSSGSSGPATPYVCDASTPSSVTGLQITNQGSNSVTLNWNAASPVSHYALIFTRNSDGEQYGAANIGNTTSYTINGVSGGASYTFEVFGVNDCQPGDRASVTSSTFSGPVLSARPVGSGGQVLGASIALTKDEKDRGTILAALEATPTPQASERPHSTPIPTVLGAEEETCKESKNWIPLILLLVLIGTLAAFEYQFRNDKGHLRYYGAGGTYLAIIGLFYLLRNCDCSVGDWLALLCQWFWAIGLLMTALTRAMGYALNENTHKQKKM